MSNTERQQELQRALTALERVDGEAAANRAIDLCAPDSSVIFLTRSEYDDLLAKKGFHELKRYKGKMIVITSDKS